MHPIVSVNDITSLIGTTYPAANQLVEWLTAIGVLAEVLARCATAAFATLRISNFLDDVQKEVAAAES